MAKIVKQVVIASQTSLKPNLLTEETAFFKSDGSAKVLPDPAAYQAASTATDVAGLKTDFNALLTKLIASGAMKSS